MAKYKIIPSSRTIVQSPISIGHKAEKGVEAIEFDLTAWVETYGSGTLTVIMRRWGDAIPYPIALEIDENNKATWTLSDTDTAKAGMAYAQLNYIVGETVVKKSDIYTFRVMDSLTGEGDPPEAYESWLEHLTHLAAEAMAEVLDIEGVVTDKTLSIEGGIADAKATGEALSALEDAVTEETDKLKADLRQKTGLSEEAKVALLNCFAHVAWIDAQGQTYYDALDDALNNERTPSSISAVFNQGSAVIYTDSSLNDLKPCLTVTARYSDGTTQTVTGYALSGILATGTSTITVTFGGKTATFNVAVTAAPNWLTMNDVENAYGFTNLTLTNGDFEYDECKSWGLVPLKQSVTNIEANVYSDIDGTPSLIPTATMRFIFNKNSNTQYYATDGTAIYLFTKNTSNGAYDAEGADSFATLTTYGRNIESGARVSVSISNGVLTVRDSVGVVMTITNANAMGWWSDKWMDKNLTRWENVEVVA